MAHAYIMSHHLVTVREMALETKISEGRVRRLLRGLVGGYVPKFAREFYEKIHNGFEGASFRYSYSVRLYQEEVRRLEFVPVYEI